MKIAALLLLALVAFLPAGAESTRYWEQSSYQALLKGTAEGVALSTDGSLRLGPRLDLIGETDSAYLWAAVQDSQGTIYAAGGSPGRVYRITPGSKPSIFFEAHEIEITALALDRQGRLYAAAAPDGPVYRITADGKSSVFFDPQTKYIWALAFDGKDNLYVATGDKGQIFRVSPSGEGKVFFDSEETHIRSMIVDAQDRVIAGTDGSGLIVRIEPDGTPFVLFESSKKEVTALAIDSNGVLYASAVGDKPGIPGQPPQPPPAVAQPQGQPLKPAPSALTTSLASGSEVYRITADGSVQKIWSSRNDIVYSLLVNTNRKLLIGTGNEGKLYEVESLGAYTNLAHLLSSQITSILRAKQGILLTASNSGRLYWLRAELTSQGTFVSEVFDAGKVSLWGRLHWKQDLPSGAAIRFETRSGNSGNPLLNWSAWKAASAGNGEAQSQSPRARFFQWKAILSSKGGDRTPVMTSLEAAYLPNNLAPVIEEVEVTPSGYKFQAPFVPAAQQRTITLQPLGQSAAPPPPPIRIQTPTQMTQEKGYVGVRWLASHENDDTLTYTLYIRGQGENEWKLLKDGLSDSFYSWDSANWPDGIYTVKVLASDSPSNASSEALSAARESTPFQIDNTPPEITDLGASRDGKRLKISFHAADRTSTIQSAEYSLDGGDWRDVLPVGRISDSRALDYQFVSDEISAGEHTVAVRVTDRFQNVGVAKVILK